MTRRNPLVFYRIILWIIFSGTRSRAVGFMTPPSCGRPIALARRPACFDGKVIRHPRNLSRQQVRPCAFGPLMPCEDTVIAMTHSSATDATAVAPLVRKERLVVLSSTAFAPLLSTFCSGPKPACLPSAAGRGPERKSGPAGRRGWGVPIPANRAFSLSVRGAVLLVAALRPGFSPRDASRMATRRSSPPRTTPLRSGRERTTPPWGRHYATRRQAPLP